MHLDIYKPCVTRSGLEVTLLGEVVNPESLARIGWVFIINKNGEPIVTDMLGDFYRGDQVGEEHPLDIVNKPEPVTRWVGMFRFQDGAIGTWSSHSRQITESYIKHLGHTLIAMIELKEGEGM